MRSAEGQVKRRLVKMDGGEDVVGLVYGTDTESVLDCRAASSVGSE
jgi:hypothetical protein